jgi:hypothetical protein
MDEVICVLTCNAEPVNQRFSKSENEQIITQIETGISAWLIYDINLKLNKWAWGKYGGNSRIWPSGIYTWQVYKTPFSEPIVIILEANEPVFLQYWQALICKFSFLITFFLLNSFTYNFNLAVTVVKQYFLYSRVTEVTNII